MKTRWRVLLGLAGFVVLAAIAVLILKKNNQSALEKYKAELRAKGEKLTYEELLGTVAEDTNATRFALLAGRLRSSPMPVGEIGLIQLVAPGRAAVAWKRPTVPLYTGILSSNSWQDIESELRKFDEELTELHHILEAPAPHFANDFGQPFNFKKRPYVEKRVTAQWLVASALSALQRGQLDRALEEIKTLESLTRLHAQDLTLVEQMVRSAIAGLALHVTWEALQAEGWSDSQLTELTAIWQGINFTEMLERGLTGERASNLALFDLANKKPGNLRGLFGMTRPGPPTAGNVIEEAGGRLWQAVAADRDQLYSLRWLTTAIESSRRLRTNEPWFHFSKEAKQQTTDMERLAASPQKFLHLMSLIAIPNFSKAGETIIRNEIFRRLTLVAIAIKRYELRHGKPPPQLDALTPGFLAEIPIDSMDGKPLKYRLSDSAFILYSVGEDGVDDQGDAQPRKAVKPELHGGRDVVWPLPATEEEIAAAAPTQNTGPRNSLKNTKKEQGTPR